MSDSLPRATMTNFIKAHISDKRKLGSDFTEVLLDLSKEFIDKVSARANVICEKEGKKTIMNDHLFEALKELGMDNMINSLEKTEETLKMKQQKKHEDKMRVQENIEQLYKRESEAQGEKEKVPLLQSKGRTQPIQIDDEQEDFAQDLDEQEEEQGSSEDPK